MCWCVICPYILHSTKHGVQIILVNEATTARDAGWGCFSRPELPSYLASKAWMQRAACMCTRKIVIILCRKKTIHDRVHNYAGASSGHSLSPSKLWVCRLPSSVVNSYHLDLFGSVCPHGSKLGVDLALFRLGDRPNREFSKEKKKVHMNLTYMKENLLIISIIQW